jgi:hypothetical protein
MKDLKQFIKTTIREFLNENTYFDGLKNKEIIMIGNDINISSDNHILPKNSLLLEHRYFNEVKWGELGLFAVKYGENNFGQWNSDFNSYGDKIAYISVGNKAKIKTINSTEDYLRKIGELEKPNAYINKKYGYKNYSELIEHGLENAELDNPSDVYYELQRKAINEMKKRGENFDVLEFLYEDAESPHQYLILNKIK